MKSCVINLGCKVNRVESDGFERLLNERGITASSVAEADLVIINTCTVTAEADKKTRKAVHRALRANGHGLILVTGCAAAQEPTVYTEMDERIEVVPKVEMASRISDLVGDSGRSGHSALHTRTGSSFAPRQSRVGIKVQDGCDNACTYCIVHVARGKARSTDHEEIIQEARRLAFEGIKEIVLTGINLGTYGYGEMDLSGLMERLLSETEGYADSRGRLCRFRLSSIEPIDIDPRLIEVIASSDGRICRHLHLPLQSGSSRVLAEMGRGYDATRFLSIVEGIREVIPVVSLTTDVIVGFPGEGDDDLIETMELARASGFSKMHVFPYSRREGTPAAMRADQIPSDVKRERAARLRALSEELRRLDREMRRGTMELAICEGEGTATSESYHQVEAPASVCRGDLFSVEM